MSNKNKLGFFESKFLIITFFENLNRKETKNSSFVFERKL
jgi:hypothetical protein